MLRQARSTLFPYTTLFRSEVVLRLHSEIKAALAAPTVVERYRQLDSEIDGGTPEEFLALVRRETPKWAEVVRRSGRSEEHTSELQSRRDLVCRLLLEKKKF